MAVSREGVRCLASQGAPACSVPAPCSGDPWLLWPRGCQPLSFMEDLGPGAEEQPPSVPQLLSWSPSSGPKPRSLTRHRASHHVPVCCRQLSVPPPTPKLLWARA